MFDICALVFALAMCSFLVGCFLSFRVVDCDHTPCASLARGCVVSSSRIARSFSRSAVSLRITSVIGCCGNAHTFLQVTRQTRMNSQTGYGPISNETSSRYTCEFSCFFETGSRVVHCCCKHGDTCVISIYEPFQMRLQKDKTCGTHYGSCLSLQDVGAGRGQLTTSFAPISFFIQQLVCQ